MTRKAALLQKPAQDCEEPDAPSFSSCVEGDPQLVISDYLVPSSGDSG